jgi:L-lysine 2,3-aminomutase
MVMSPKIFAKYIDKIIEAKIPHLQTIRIGTKSLTYWPYTFIEKGGETILEAFQKAIDNDIHVSFMAHFNHPNEMKTEAVKEAIKRILATGAKIRTQAPVFNHINANSRVWAEMWKLQVKMGLIPYYMFIARDTGAQHYFAVSLEKCWEIFRNAYQQIPGIARTVRGPSMSAGPGKVQILGVSEAAGEKVFTLRFIQGRNANWAHRPFFAKFDKEAIWLDDLKPAFGEDKFFFEDELEDIYAEKSKVMDEIGA